LKQIFQCESMTLLCEGHFRIIFMNILMFIFSHNVFRKDPELYNERISRDIRHLAVRIASTIESPEQLTQFCQENGGFKPLFECIHEGALLFNGNSYDLADYTRVPSKEILTKEKLEKEEIFSAASSACKALRDLSNLSQDVASVLTDSALQMNITKENKGEITLIDDLVSLLRYVNKYEKASQRLSSIVRLDKNSGLKNVLQRLSKWLFIEGSLCFL